MAPFSTDVTRLVVVMFMFMFMFGSEFEVLCSIFPAAREPGTPNSEPRTELEHEPRSKNTEA